MQQPSKRLMLKHAQLFTCFTFLATGLGTSDVDTGFNSTADTSLRIFLVFILSLMGLAAITADPAKFGSK
jgi:hypothetical protein